MEENARNLNPLHEFQRIIEQLQLFQESIQMEINRLKEEREKCRSKNYSTKINTEAWESAIDILNDMKGAQYVNMYKKIDEAIGSKLKRP